MDPQDDPEARIRELERPLKDVARELGTDQYGGYPPPAPPTYPMPTQGWYGGQQFPAPQPPRRNRLPLILGVAVVAFLAIGGGVFAFTASRVTSGLPISSTPTRASGGGGGFDTTPSTPGGFTLDPAPTVEPPMSGDRLSVSGIGESKALACDGSVVSISGVSNTVVITGDCASVQVSGVSNIVTLDSAGAINASGFQNRITFHSGQPEISNSGSGNTVEQG